MKDRPRPISEHLKELQRRIFYALIPFPVGFILALVFYRPLVEVLLIPARGHLSPSATPIVTSPTEFMGLTIKIALVSGFALALPTAIWQGIMFVAPALSTKAQRLLFVLVPAALILFCAGITMGYFMVLPTMLRFLLSFGSDLVTPMIRVSDYVNLITILLSGLGLAFETPLVMYVLAKLRIVSYKGFSRFRKYMIVLAFVIGAIFDPTPNPFDQIVVAGTIITLYHVGILLAYLTRPRKEVQQPATVRSSPARVIEH